MYVTDGVRQSCVLSLCVCEVIVCAGLYVTKLCVKFVCVCEVIVCERWCVTGGRRLEAGGGSDRDTESKTRTLHKVVGNNYLI